MESQYLVGIHVDQYKWSIGLETNIGSIQTHLACGSPRHHAKEGLSQQLPVLEVEGQGIEPRPSGCPVLSTDLRPVWLSGCTRAGTLKGNMFFLRYALAFWCATIVLARTGSWHCVACLSQRAEWNVALSDASYLGADKYQSKDVP